jgi:hypothetical protein
LNRVGFDVDVTVAFDDAAPPDRAKIEAAAGAVLDLQGLDAWFDGDQDDLRAVAALLKGLTPAEADAFVAAIPADALESLNDRARIPDFPKEYMPWVHNGVPWMELVDLTSDLLSKVARPHWRKLQDAFPGIQPPADKIVTARAPGGTVPEYGEAGNSIFQDADGDGRPDLSGSEVRQGRLGDCAFVAALAAVASADPGFVQGGIRQNLNGTVSVRIYASGQEHWVTVTPDLPLTPGRRFVSAVGLNYARTSDGRGNDEGPLVLWPAYYEKAFAVAFTEAKAGAPADRVNDPGYTEDDHSYRAIEAELAARDAPYLTGNEISLSNNLPALRTSPATRSSSRRSTPSRTCRRR